MPRRLPWLEGSKTSSSAVSSPSAKRRRLSDSRFDGNELDMPAPLTPRQTSPKPEQLLSSPTMELATPTVPKISYMEEGYDADDAWMMVEDEFNSTAQIFTRHLHHEEYLRVRKLAKSRPREAMDNIVRAVDRLTEQTNETKVKLRAGEASKSIKRALKVREMSEDDLHESHLASLMPRHHTAPVDLSTLISNKVHTKAAAGVKVKEVIADPNARNVEPIEMQLSDNDSIDTIHHTQDSSRSPADHPTSQQALLKSMDPVQQPVHGSTIPSIADNTQHTNEPQIIRSSSAAAFLAARRATLEKKRQEMGLA